MLGKHLPGRGGSICKNLRRKYESWLRRTPEITVLSDMKATVTLAASYQGDSSVQIPDQREFNRSTGKKNWRPGTQVYTRYSGRREIGQSSEVKETSSSWTLENDLSDAGERGENSTAASLSGGRGRVLPHQCGWRIKCVQVAWWGEWWRPYRAIQLQVRFEFFRDQIMKGLPCQAQMFGLCSL